MSEDESILLALRAGEEHAARALWLRFAPVVRQVLRRMVGDANTEDLAQDAFLTVFSRVHKLKEPAALRSFIVSIAKFTARDERRKRARARRHAGGDLADVSDQLVVTTDVDSREGLFRFAMILGRHGPRERAAFALRFLQGKDLVETASALGVSISTAKRRSARARNRIAFLAGRDPALRPYVSSGLRAERQAGHAP
jgi:RNA polymerase sigma-70 factor (ECF subfamily)